MAGGPTRYRTAHAAGARGAELPAGLASRADSDPMIDAAHDAGRNGIEYDQFATANGIGSPAPTIAPKQRKSSGIRRTGRPTPPTVLNPTGGRLPIGTGATSSIAGAFFGAIFYALALSVADYGPTGPLLWFKAKFLNQPTTAPAGAKK